MALRLSLTKEVLQALCGAGAEVVRGMQAEVIHVAMDRLGLSLSHYLLPLLPLD